MCVGIPMKLIKRDGNLGVVALDEVERKISLALLEKAEIGDYLIIHAGFAIECIDPEAARETLDLFRELAELAGDRE
jgi:hydrogenase expression/formation protein HypC